MKNKKLEENYEKLEGIEIIRIMMIISIKEI